MEREETMNAVLAFLSSLVLLITRQPADTVTVRQLAGMLPKKNFTLINVHTPYEGEIANTDLFIPYDQIVANSALLPKDKNAPIILYCRTGRMSTEALPVFKKLGYTNVRQLAGGMEAWKKSGKKLLDLSSLEEQVAPAAGTTLPISWGDLPVKLVNAGVIDQKKFTDAVKTPPDFFSKASAAPIRIDRSNAQFIADVFWAIGLAQKSIVYDEGPMGNEYKKDLANFASTGGWTIGRGDALTYFNKFDLIPLTPDQQKRVAVLAQNIYRPCCGNPTWFPDCNHGMAALAAIEMMVAAGVDDNTIYKNLLLLNSYWFTKTYLTTATYFARRNIAWNTVDAKEILGQAYSSAQGAATIAGKVGPLPYQPQQGGNPCAP